MAPRVRIDGFDDTEPTPPPAVVPSPLSRSPSPSARLDNDKGKGKAIDDQTPVISEDGSQSELDPDTCAICLSDIWNKAETSPCHHNLFCFACLNTWSEMSRRCPLCNSQIDFIMTHVRSETDFQKHYLLPMPSAPYPRRSSDPPVYPAAADIDLRTRRQIESRPTHPRYRWGARNTRRVHLEEADENELALQRRKWIYKHKLYAKHVAANAYTRYQSFTPQQFANSQDRKSRVVKFARRELQVFPNVDVEWLVTYLLQIMCQLDLRTDNAIRLLSEFLGFEEAEHFAHEVLTFARSPYSDPRQWDLAIQYDRPECHNSTPLTAQLPPPTRVEPPPSRRPLSPDPYEREVKRRRPSAPSPPRPLERDTYIPDYQRHRPAYRDDRPYRSPLRRRSYPSPERRPRSPPPRRREPSPLPPPKRRSPSPAPQPEPNVLNIEDDPPAEPSTAAANGNGGNGKGLKIAGLAAAKARRESLQSRLAAEKATQAEALVIQQRKAEEETKNREMLMIKIAAATQRNKVEAKLKEAKREALRGKLMARLEEERVLALKEVGSETGLVIDLDTDDEGEDEVYYREEAWDREEVLRRALEARSVQRVDPKARLAGELASMEARLAAIKAQMWR